jgi:MoxR-like ATPase
MVFGASNEPPTDQDLSAFYDRFPIRVMCNPVSDERDALRRTLTAANMHLVDDVLGGAKRKPQIASVNHFRLMFRLILVREVTWRGPEATEFWDSFVNTFRMFRREFQISDRSISRLYRLAQGLALMRKKKYPGRSEVEVIKYCFRDLESAAALADAVDERVHRR